MIVTLGDATDDRPPDRCRGGAARTVGGARRGTLPRPRRRGRHDHDRGAAVHALYARSADWLEAFQRSLREHLPTRRLTVKAGIDPGWTLYDTFVAPT